MRNPLDWTTQRMKVQMVAARKRIRQEIKDEQVTCVKEQYAPGSERLERLYVQIEQAKRWTSPRELTFNF